MRIKATLRNGNEYILVLEEPGGNPADVFVELAAGRSQALRGWVRVEPSGDAKEIVVLGDEIVELHLIAE